ncbi:MULTISPECIES: hypothetical protein [unclassified Psychrobacter]|uniref:hypothetical protein n=1 Tax=unclassified Psychrobacter TaxID=196806 RepID=UPI0025B58BC8|nr:MULTISPECIES: hypothetical protein [unclassified Psychrobacter]MDN3453033.1 hypothetical protein [Psychrobacter sp. APC 3350]MDN3501403.1 hypothetical protein [Psychrobacter sp. 5A.1]
MTEPTAKLSAGSNSRQDATATAKKESNVNKNTAIDHSHVGKTAPKDTIVATPDKAALLTMFTLSDANETATEAIAAESSDTLTATAKTAAQESSIAAQRVALYHTQHERTRLLYMASANTRPTYLVQTLKLQFAEYQQYLLAQQLDKRGLMDVDTLERLWHQLHVVDDVIADIVRHMPAQQPAGWQLTTQDGRNPLCFATVGKLKHGKPIRDQGSLNSYVLGHFGVSSFTYDRGYYIGHVVGYLFSCYYCAHLSISYGVTALGQQVVADYDYASLETPHMVRLLQGLDGYCKKRIYQLAVICARLSVFASDKRIERMLIAEVNDFDKKLQQQHLDVLLLQGLMPDSNDSTPLF